MPTVKTIIGDKTKTQTFCDISKLGDQADEAAQKKDMKKVEELNQKMEELVTKIGPEYAAFMKRASGYGSKFTRGSEDRFNAPGVRQVVSEVATGFVRSRRLPDFAAMDP